MMNITSEQKAAIYYRENKSAAVSASAGSGKTFVLVEHVAELISDQVNKTPADRLAAVTFTEKAAAELRQRLELRVSELLAREPDNLFLRDQLVRLSSARISTISSFCLSLIRENIRLLPGLDEGFGICDETTAKILSEKAMNKTLERIYKSFSEKGKEEIAKTLGDSSDIAASAESLYRFLSNMTDPKKWIREQYNIFSDPDLYYEKYTKEIASDAEQLENAVDEYNNAIAQLEGNSKKTAQNYVRYFSFFRDNAAEAIRALADNNFTEALEILSRKYDCRTPPAGGEFAFCKEIREENGQILEQAKEAIGFMASCENDAEYGRKALLRLRRIEGIYENNYRRLKKEQNLLDFSDLERNALAAVKAGGGANTFDYIIVDEFQDSNDIQYEIFSRLSDNEKNLYLVGDTKQCIYAFRNANPKIFARLCEAPNYTGLQLNRNFRSSDNVLNSVNDLFGKGDMPESFAEGRWTDMQSGRGIEAREENKTEFVTVNMRSKNENKEEKYVAKRILDMVSNGFAVHNKDNTERPCGFGDFAVLVRNNGDCIRFRKVLEQYNIPCVSQGEKHFTDLTEIDIALSILETVLRPHNDTAAAKAMMSPVYGFTSEDMARLRLINPKEHLYSNIDGLITGEDGILAHKAAKFDSDIKLFRKTASNNVTYQLLQQIYEITLLPQIMRAGYSGREREENLRLLLYYGKNTPRPADFLTLMNNISKSRLEMEQAVVKGREEGSVKIMTMHKSKGLQFPVVFVSDINRRPNKTDTYRDFMFDTEKGAGILVCDYENSVRAQTASHRALEKEYKAQLDGEAMRLLYVAMTRAEEKLIITASNKIGKETETAEEEMKNAVAYEGNYFDLLLKNSDNIKDSVEIKRIFTDEVIDPAPAEGEEKAAPQLPDIELIVKRIGTAYPYEKAVITPAKFTATALGVNPEATGEDTTANAFYMGMPLFMKKDRPLSGKELGDIYHSVMEHLDFNAEEAEKELNRLEAERVLTKKEREAVKAAEIQGFLNSSLCKRARSADRLYKEFPIFTTVNAAEIDRPDNEDLSFIQGIADMFFEENGELVLADYKTNRNVTADKLIREYKGQLMIYKKAIEEMCGIKVKECYLFSFSLGREIKVEM